ncbi:nucleoside hydrolase [Klenkia taihuensis]|uniref:Purine nucleosidase n=1 Tax=Klenkia taihuensis TaxID=1225127 RepID=A0A1I1GJJ3_9ACTN|nr:nucleoside hydrolase [Klenkia taihuensis]GHE09697.1 nucleoside hydrolase [Klenkia taihuensis]SFC11947.1 purine nucleosidase [Klenkia taihuensis]
MVARTPVFLDCDPGIDDVLAIAFLLTRLELELVGIGTVSGNLDAAGAARNTLQVLDLLGAPAIPVAAGTRDFRTRAYAGGAPDVHGTNGIGDVELPPTDRVLDPRGAVQLLLDLAHEHRGALRVLAIGPLTNLAAALDADPELPGLVRDVVVMGGAFTEPGNITPHAEANIWNDPEAADLVFAAPWPVTALPVDAARRQRLEAADLDELRADASPVVGAIGRMLDVYGEFYRGVFGQRLAVLYDPLAAALLTDAVQVVRELTGPVVVTTGDGEERGRTVVGGVHPGRPEHRVVLATEPAFAPLLVAALSSLG